MAFAFPVTFAKSVKKAEPIKKRKKKEPHFPTEQQITDAEEKSSTRC